MTEYVNDQMNLIWEKIIFFNFVTTGQLKKMSYMENNEGHIG